MSIDVRVGVIRFLMLVLMRFISEERSGGVHS